MYMFMKYSEISLSQTLLGQFNVLLLNRYPDLGGEFCTLFYVAGTMNSDLIKDVVHISEVSF